MSDLAAAVGRARGPQPLWAAVPPAARARYLRRAAQALLDEVDDLAVLLAQTAGVPRTEAMLAELLPAVAGLGSLAEDGPEALEDRRLGRSPVRRRASVVRAPVGVVGIRAGSASPWAEPVLEVAAALLAGNGVVLAAGTAERVVSLLERAGVPEGLVQPLGPDIAPEALAAACDGTTETEPDTAKATVLVLDGAPLDRAVDGVLWAAFARAGRGPAAVGRLVVLKPMAAALVPRLVEGAGRLRVGDPLDPATEVGPLGSEAEAERVAEVVEEAVADGATLLCGGRVGRREFAPAVLTGVPSGARLLQERVPGPVLAVTEVDDEPSAVSVLHGASRSASVWAADRRHGERLARSLGVERAWVNDHGVLAPSAPARLDRYVVDLELGSSPTLLRSARWLPYDPVLVRATAAAARLLHGRESQRPAALRAGAAPLAHVAVRLAREALRRT